MSHAFPSRLCIRSLHINHSYARSMLSLGKHHDDCLGLSCAVPALDKAISLKALKGIIITHLTPKRLPSLRALLKKRKGLVPLDVHLSNPALQLLRSSLGRAFFWLMIQPSVMVATAFWDISFVLWAWMRLWRVLINVAVKSCQAPVSVILTMFATFWHEAPSYVLHSHIHAPARHYKQCCLLCTSMQFCGHCNSMQNG